MSEERCETMPNSISSVQQHCIHVEKIYDWVTRFTPFKLEECIQMKKLGEIVNDNICTPFTVSAQASEPTIIWLNNQEERLEVSFTLTYESGHADELIIFVDDKEFARLAQGQSFVGNAKDVQVISVMCSNHFSANFCTGEITLCIQRLFDQEKTEKKLNSKCFLSDSCGNPIQLNDEHSIICKEVSDPKNRETITIMMPNKEKVQLQKVEILKKGFVTVLLHDGHCIHKKCIIPFAEIETFFLCAPNKTKIECKMTSFKCQSFTVPLGVNDCDEINYKLIVKVDICQSVLVSEKVKLEVAALLFDTPRTEVQRIQACEPTFSAKKEHCNLLLCPK